MWNNVRVLCVGDVMLDTFVYGSVDRLSPEAPVPVLARKQNTHMCGGAGNVAANMAALGAQVTLVGLVGNDWAGQQLKKLIDDQVEARFVFSDQRATTHKTRFVSQGKHLLRVDEEATDVISQEIEDSLIDVIRQALKDHAYTVVVGSDYAKGVMTPKVCKALVDSGMPVLMDPKGSDYRPYKGVTLISPNMKELYAATPAGSTQERVAHLMASMEVPYVLLTQGADGMTLFSQTEKPFHVAAEAQEVFDVSGAGDTVMATLAVVYASGQSLPEAVVLANRAAGIVVAKVGTSVISIEQLLSEHSQLPWKDQIARWKQKGEVVGFTNGCFDCLHPGHLHALRQARQNCQRLVVGLNSDASVKRLKGDSRPIQTEDVRATMLDALPEVDLVITFDDDTPLELIKAVMPDVLVKGADYTVDQVVGADLVQKSGGRVVLAEMLPGHSTTVMIQRLK